MNRIYGIILALLLPLSVYAQPAFTGGMDKYMEAGGSLTLGAGAGKNINLGIGGERILKCTGSLTATTCLTDTTDGADSSVVTLCAGGADSLLRGACIHLYGNENNGGVITFNPGSVGNPSMSMGGDLLLFISGTTISMQEATPTTACMGVATPNGTTPVAVTTSCAYTNARIFYSRLGAVTNMGTVSTTTAPNGTAFSFASTSALDTLAGSVIWFIIKESA